MINLFASFVHAGATKSSLKCCFCISELQQQMYARNEDSLILREIIDDIEMYYYIRAS